MSKTGPSPATARHEVANLLHRYTDAADRADVPAAVALLGRASIRFPSDAATDPAGAAALFDRLWSGAVPHRHDVSTLVVEDGPRPGNWIGRAHYTRWVLEPGREPLLHTLGEYRLTVSEDGWDALELLVTRTWTRG